MLLLGVWKSWSVNKIIFDILTSVSLWNKYNFYNKCLVIILKHINFAGRPRFVETDRRLVYGIASAVAKYT